jgi:hypothetical protein
MSESEARLPQGGQHRSSASGTVLIGDEANPVPVQLVQSVYNELTGKSETVGKTYKDPFAIEYTDVEKLHHRISQFFEQYHICASNCSVTVYYVNNSKDVFSGFDRFRLHNAGSASAVESVLLKYNFLDLLCHVSYQR